MQEGERVEENKLNQNMIWKAYKTKKHKKYEK